MVPYINCCYNLFIYLCPQCSFIAGIYHQIQAKIIKKEFLMKFLLWSINFYIKLAEFIQYQA